MTPSLDLLVSLLREVDVSFSQFLPFLLDRMQDNEPLPWHVIWSAAFLSVALWQPLFEELLFRGVIQGYMVQSMRKQNAWSGLSLANVLTSLLFTMAHLASHPISWSLIVFLPSVCFGFVRDRFGSVYPAIVLHALYNTGYFLLIGGATLLNSR